MNHIRCAWSGDDILTGRLNCHLIRCQFRSDDSLSYRLVYQHRIRRTGFDSRSQNPKMNIFSDFIIIVMSSRTTKERVSCSFYAALYSSPHSATYWWSL